MQHGRPAEQPAAVIQWCTPERQRSVTGSLAEIAALAEAADLAAPAVLVVGEVARLHATLDWFRRGPLAGIRVLVTRARDQASRLSRLLAERGAIPVEFPAIEIEWLADPAPLDAALRRLREYD